MPVRGYYSRYRRRYTAELVATRYDQRQHRLDPGPAPLPVREQQDAANNTGAISFTLDIGTQVGDTILLICANDFYTPTQLLTPTGTAVTTWTLQHTLDGGSNDSHAKVWTGTVTTGGASTVVTNWNTAAPDEERYAGLWVLPVGVFDGAASTDADTTSTSQVAPSVTPISGATDDLLVCLFGTDSTGTTTYAAMPASMTAYPQRDVGGFTSFKAAEQLTSSGPTGTRTATVGTARNWFALSVLMQVTVTAAAIPTSSALVVSTLWTPTVPETYISSSQPLGNPAVGTPGPLVVGPGFAPPPLPVVYLFGPGAPAAAVVSAPGVEPLVVSPPYVTPTVPPVTLAGAHATATTGGPLVATPPFQPVPIPAVSITASQPLGNPAVATPGPMVVSTPWAAKVPGALITSNPAAPVVSTVATPNALVVTPPFTPVPIPPVSITASRPLGNPATATPQPLVVTTAPSSVLPRPFIAAGAATTSTGQLLLVAPTFTLAPVPGAKVFAAPSAPAAPPAPTPGTMVVTPPWRPVPIPKTYLSANFPLGNPAVRTPQPMVVSPVFRWPLWTASLVGSGAAVHLCSTPRPSTGTTAYSTATTPRPSSGTTAYSTTTTPRPFTGTTSPPC